jgi:hypothetical protein
MSDNLAAFRSLKSAAAAMRALPQKIGEFYANGGPGVSQPIVADRFQGEGNARFAPLSENYEAIKAGRAKSLNAGQKQKYGHGSRLLPRPGGGGKSLPILVASGALRNAVGYSRNHRVTSSGDTAQIAFIGLPEYAIYHHTGAPKVHLPKRSPVDPDTQDVIRIREFAERWLSAQVGRGSASTAFGQGQARVI